ncbi:ComF family protein [Thioalkalicoccus limnaeus]|uniref:ComF family protein n=1 Tax=Thioalkalicoccus limnaeus TaxID=120681 RepID=A0ABV4BA63_9GAMM
MARSADPPPALGCKQTDRSSIQPVTLRTPVAWRRRGLDWLFPPTCALCGAPGQPGLDLCTPCERELPGNLRACPACAQPWPLAQPADPLCRRCRRRPPPFTAAHVPFLYEGILPALIAGAKFRGRLHLVRLVGTLLARALAEQRATRPALLVPVPLHASRLRERGYNQAHEIARTVATELGLAVDARCCERIRATSPQMGLTGTARRRNLRGAFGLRAVPDADHIAVIDDVVTTGTTAAELARTLLRTGVVTRVDLWGVARTP